MEAAGSGGGGRGVCRRGRGAHAVCQCLRSRKVACNSIGRSFNKVRKRCNSNDLNSKLEAVAGELRAKLGVGSAMMWILINTPGPAGVEGTGGSGGPGCGARGRWRCMVAVPVGGGRAREGLEIDHSEPSGSRVAISRAGRRPPAHTAARPFKAGLRRPEHQRGHKHQHAAQTARGRAAAHGHTERPDRTRQIMRSGWRVGRRPPAPTAARPNKIEDPATGSLATRAAAEQCTGCTAIGTAADQRKTPAQPPSFTASQQHAKKSYEKYESFIGSS